MKFDGIFVTIGDLDCREFVGNDGTLVLDRYGAECSMPQETLALIHENEMSPGGAKTRLTEKIDVFAAGRSLFYVLTNGRHPFAISSLVVQCDEGQQNPKKTYFHLFNNFKECSLQGLYIPLQCFQKTIPPWA